VKTYICHLPESIIEKELYGWNLMKLDAITDNHMHIDPVKGVGIEAAKLFKRAGGTCLFLVNKMSRDTGVVIRESNDFCKVFENTVSIKERIKREVGLEVFAVVGVHPAELVFLCNEFGVERALEIAVGAIDIAGRQVNEGKGTALGEIGRPHFEVDANIIDASNQLLEHAMRVAKEVGCAVQLHTESSSEALFKDISSMAKNTGLDPEKVVKHFNGPEVNLAEKYGIMPSVISSKENATEVLKAKNLRFLLESDYIDDLSRPGAVLGPKTVPRVTKKLVEEGLLSLDDATRIHKDNVEKVYGVELG
jgi:TatD-related deoxyribonuclease